MNQKHFYVAPETELILVRFEENILSGVDTQSTTVSDPWASVTEEEL